MKIKETGSALSAIQIKGILANAFTAIRRLQLHTTHFLSKLKLFVTNNYITIAAVLLVFLLPFIVRAALWQTMDHNIKATEEEILTEKENLTTVTAELGKKLAAKTPKSYYLVINSASNVFSLYKGTELIKKDKCSTGSYIKLKGREQQEWMFNTPKGEFKILGKTTSPVWRKPDWAFIEEGLPVPSAGHPSRYEANVLGDYALSLGDGYLIHGTLYQRFLGLPVTHGCIRLNDENLELVYKSMPVGSKVYIF